MLKKKLHIFGDKHSFKLVLQPFVVIVNGLVLVNLADGGGVIGTKVFLQLKLVFLVSVGQHERFCAS